jgi:tRNA G18 (ribose-2'-O)-methylase SpoU
MVTDRYLNIFHHNTVDEFVAAMKQSGREVIAIDNQAGSVPLAKTELGNKIVLVFGGEGPGLSQEMINASTKMIHIEQFGSTRSVNVGVAAGIVMYEWVRTHHLENMKT